MWLAISILWTSKGGVNICLPGAASKISCIKWISGDYGIASLAKGVTFTIVNITRFHADLTLKYLNLVVIWSLCDPNDHCVTFNFGFWHSAYALYIAPYSKMDVVVFDTPWDLQYCPLEICFHRVLVAMAYPLRLYHFELTSTVLTTWYFTEKWCYIDEHYFSFSGAWGIWPLLCLYIIISVFVYGSWIWIWHCDRDIWSPAWYLLGYDGHAQGIIISGCIFYFLVILHRMVIWWCHRNYFALVLLETLWCSAELSALHRVLWCWNFVLDERYFGERSWGLRRFCDPEENCIEHFQPSTSFLNV